MKAITLDWDTASRITCANLKEYRTYLKKELSNYKKGQWLHPEDVEKNKEVIKAIDIVIAQFEH